MTSEKDQDQNLGRVLEAFSLIIGRWTAVGMADLILERAGVDADAASMTLLLELRRTGGAARPSHLAQATRTSASNVSKVLARMTRAGLVERAAEPDDLRAVSIVLTGEGHRTAELIDRTSVEMLGELLKDWPEDDVDRLGGLLGRFARSLRASFPT
ncbi:MarR family winged helix-turn-helix transcriptional regulator [Actinocorallia populi]|uniref:MarR family winged helix-turn-helix transcriptional regulator n=1 Tax=Actinocorallia populi TaxID=2079200 RepID=UPI000D0970F8|nr:MarR family transcriptional regulator [Actinocorallia populi]